MEIKKFEGELFWNADNPECGVYDPDDELAGIGEVGSIVGYKATDKENRALDYLFLEWDFAFEGC